jgi:hypothetical protein
MTTSHGLWFVDMSTIVSALLLHDEIECGHELHSLLHGLEANSSLFQPEQLRERLIALDDLDAGFGSLDSEDSTTYVNSQLLERARELKTRFEAANTERYQFIRSEFVRRGRPDTLLRWLQGSESQNKSTSPLPGLGFDSRDELVSGILQLRDPSDPSHQRLPEMVPYQPTPVRHILHLIAACQLAEEAVFVDIGSGLGHVPLLVSMLTGVRSLGIEVQAAYVARAQECAQSLGLRRVRFIPQDARDADLSSGTVFYLYSPFSGSILAHVLRMLRIESTRRSIRICSLGPCTRTVANERWVRTTAQLDPGRITAFESR